MKKLLLICLVLASCAHRPKTPVLMCEEPEPTHEGAALLGCTEDPEKKELTCSYIGVMDAEGGGKDLCIVAVAAKNCEKKFEVVARRCGVRLMIPPALGGDK